MTLLQTPSFSLLSASVGFWPMVMTGLIDALIACVILVFGWLLSRWVFRLTRDGLHGAKFVDPTLKPLAATIARYAVLAITLVAVLQQFGVQTTSLIAVMGAAGLAIGLALQGTLSNVASGVMLLALQPVRAGEEIVIDDITGTVREVGLFRTVLITPNGEYVSKPNTAIFGSTIVNNSREATRRVEFKVALDADADIGRAIDIASELLRAERHVLGSPAPSVIVHALSDSAVLLSVRAWATSGSFDQLRSDLQRSIRDRYNEAGIARPNQLLRFSSARVMKEPAQASSSH